MKMAKASTADLDAAMELASAFEALAQRHGATLPEKMNESDEIVFFYEDNASQCQEVLDYLLNVALRGSLFRVAFGMSVLLDPANKLVDPEADTLEHHPDTVTAKQERDHYRAQRDELLSAVNVLRANLAAMEAERRQDNDLLSTAGRLLDEIESNALNGTVDLSTIEVFMGNVQESIDYRKASPRPAYVPLTNDELMDAAIVGRRAWEEAGKPEGLLVPMQRRAIEQATAARLGGVPP